MQGYLDPAKNFGDDCDPGWDPQVVDDALFPLDEIFCLIGTDPADYGWGPRTVMGPQTDGLVHIANAYVRGAHRAYVYKSHSGSYGEVNSEERMQNLRRFLFGRWAVEAALAVCRLPPGGRHLLADGHAPRDPRHVGGHERADHRALVSHHADRPGAR